MKKKIGMIVKKWFGLCFLFLAAVLMLTVCTGMPSSVSGTDQAGILHDPNGNLKGINKSGVPIALYIDKGFKGIVPSGDSFSYLVVNAESVGTIVDLECFNAEKLKGKDLSLFPAEGRMYGFPKTVRPPGSGEVSLLELRPLTDIEESGGAAGADYILVKFSYLDMPRVASAVSVFQGGSINQKALVRLDNGDARLVPMPVGISSINLEYNVGGLSGIQRKAYPTTDTQRHDMKFILSLSADMSEVDHVIPRISDIFKVSYVKISGTGSTGSLVVTNGSSLPVKLNASKGDGPVQLIENLALRSVKGTSGFLIGQRRQFQVSPGVYSFKAIDALGGYDEVSRIDEVKIEGGMVYYYTVTEEGLGLIEEKLDLTIDQAVKNFFQSWTIETNTPGAAIKISVRSRDPTVQEITLPLGTTNRDGRLSLREVDVAGIVRGLSTENARGITLTITAEKTGFEAGSASFGAITLLKAGKTFIPDRIHLERIEEPEGGNNVDLIIGDPLVM
jgi:hypothetical protein